jgi:transcriptional regulator with XRE-family HTH domain
VQLCDLSIFAKNSYMQFAKALKILRHIKGLTQVEIAQGVFMDERTYREIESGRKSISAEQVQTFADFFQVEVKLIYDIAQDSISTQNIVHEAKRDGIVINNAQEESKELITYLLGRIKDLEQEIKILREQGDDKGSKVH